MLSDAINSYQQFFRSLENLPLEVVLGKKGFSRLHCMSHHLFLKKDFPSHVEYAVNFYNKSDDNILVGLDISVALLAKTILITLQKSLFWERVCFNIKNSTCFNKILQQLLAQR